MRYLFCFFIAFSAFAYEVGQKIPEGTGISQNFGKDSILNIQIEANHFNAYILNEERVVQEPPYEKGFIRYRYISGPNRNQQFSTPLYPENGHYCSPRTIKPPHYFFLYVRFRDKDNHFTEIPRMRYPNE